MSECKQMNIPWRYLDKRGATICAIEDYESMKHILSSTAEEVQKLSCNPQSEEEHDVQDIDIHIIRYQEAKEYMDWFQPGWDALSEDERCVLTLYYQCKENTQTDNIEMICEHFFIERSTAYKKKNKALDHLTLLLYGK